MNLPQWLNELKLNPGEWAEMTFDEIHGRYNTVQAIKTRHNKDGIFEVMQGTNKDDLPAIWVRAIRKPEKSSDVVWRKPYALGVLSPATEHAGSNINRVATEALLNPGKEFVLKDINKINMLGEALSRAKKYRHWHAGEQFAVRTTWSTEQSKGQVLIKYEGDKPTDI